MRGSAGFWCGSAALTGGHDSASCVAMAVASLGTLKSQSFAMNDARDAIAPPSTAGACMTEMKLATCVLVRCKRQRTALH
jgi:hypothetical protein